MPSKRRISRAAPAQIVPNIRPVVRPVLERLARNEKLLLELKASLDIQFKRTAQIQAQLDRLLARLARSER